MFRKRKKKITMEGYIEMDNLPAVANQVLNVLWDKNRPTSVSELTEAVNEQFHVVRKKEEIEKAVALLTEKEYAVRVGEETDGLYAALGYDLEYE